MKEGQRRGGGDEGKEKTMKEREEGIGMLGRGRDRRGGKGKEE